MLHVLNVYAHGYVLVPVVAALKRHGVFSYLEEVRDVDISVLEHRFRANKGHFRTAVKLLEVLDWVQIEKERLRLTHGHAFVHSINDSLRGPYEADFAREPLAPANRPVLEQCIRSILAGSATLNDESQSTLLAGPLAVTLLTAISRDLRAAHLSEDDAIPKQLSQIDVASVGAFTDWIKWTSRRRLTHEGRFAFEHATNLGICASYRPMLSNIDKLLFGDAKTVFAPRSTGEESHVDRVLNVQSSGAQHGKFFSGVHEILSAIFDADVSTQPKYIVDMGCGNGEFLRSIYKFVSTHTARGRLLNEHPLLLIGVDLNSKALEQTAATLHGLPHITVQGDIGCPEALLIQLERLGHSDRTAMLHVRSFLDHELPLGTSALDTSQVGGNIALFTDATVTRDGTIVEPRQVALGYIAHFSKWAEALSSHGLISIEVHRLALPRVREYFSESESFYFDAIHALSGQSLLDASSYLMVLAAAGLFPVDSYAFRYPRRLPYTRISVNWLRPQPYRIRYGCAADLAIAPFDGTHATADVERVRQELECEIKQNAKSTFVLEQDGAIVALLCARLILIADDISGELPRCGLQLVFLTSSVGRGTPQTAAELVKFALCVISCEHEYDVVVSVGRSSNLETITAQPTWQKYHEQATRDGTCREPILAACLLAGSTSTIAPRTWLINGRSATGDEVILQHSFSDICTKQDRTKPSAGVDDVHAHIEDAVQQAMPKALVPSYSPDVPFDDLGLDSMDLTEIRALLEKRFGLRLSAEVMLTHDSVNALASYVKNSLLDTFV
jgi:acyl carrier protein